MTKILALAAALALGTAGMATSDRSAYTSGVIVTIDGAR
jgi:hypothetical protein